ncbi:2-oxo-4-hydroxy-4-carboxy-5-ureidoimidazoline decarboxylase [Flavisolibacter ginsenosidimutans]|uniref:2-oxo-4-hydroxy-4-carboxy-5-ureidoimidazoline decarboxylase n=1 Tax=Flavisolibacter ginsenosidimutans TaxID=661481 RepID=A0A5B8UPY2_9BACT|nr:2-oxo-4-hydroxy-4-carboxy-5-ureidoimidazoline decarboxylase [Flavisolibacter ginsenosidimutans]QEC58005.1 2-oxo-4-hydroxy-4-carboxy-5-ureidoimidazoline decarboxylase [Flavisolibacter ginsenosidimutans]
MTLTELNNLPSEQRKNELRKCCGAEAWVEKMNAAFPFLDEDILLQSGDEVWNGLTKKDWLEAFTHHPKIGDVNSLKEKFAATAKWASGEQSSVQQASQHIIEELAKGNSEYEAKFGYIFIVCATGKSADEMLQILKTRLPNSKEEEIKIAAAEQARITKLRLEKLLA